MPAIWSSSERPISVRTVWVDGIRHAILSPDDPLVDTESRRRSRSSRNKSYTTNYHHPETELNHLNNCFANLHVVVGNNHLESKTSSQVYRKLSAPPYPRMSTPTFNTEGESSFDDNGKVEKVHRDRRIGKRKDGTRGRSAESERDSKPNIMECKQAQGTLDTFWNPLFERVLQWLDLSGRAQSYDFEEDSVESSPGDEERKWSPVKRRFPRFKRESFVERERMAIQNYKLYKERNPEHVESEENKVKRLPKIECTREECSENGETSSSLLKPCVKSKEHVGNKVQTERKASSMWSPPGRLQLHIMMPNLVCEENASSLESLIND
ncbi:uncharacterized protein LOC128874887 [Hylaeus volcanicus]|uniref:uncharacterized protein LOC128874887 n=1 Tax=Hylaeus volcanicus TaxID=313075 RepID=UPI0023B7BCFC|nr:uncharacterized protein LOC128874887 [Hylaeus volcanicus]